MLSILKKSSRLELMKKVIIFSILTLGISSIISQLLVIRELVISFYGNEFFIGWIFFSWLFWTGTGSLLLVKILKIHNFNKALINCHLLATLSLPLVFVLIRLARTFITETGQVPDLVSSLGYSFLILAPLCLVLGFQFVAASQALKSLSAKTIISESVNRVYIGEIAGFTVGGIIFSSLLVTLNELLIVLFVGLLNLLVAILITYLTKNTSIFQKITLITLIFILAAFLGQFDKINNKTNNWRYPNQKLIETENTIYTNLAVTEIGNQYNFYSNGLLLATNIQDIHQEHLAHLPLLFHSNPERILLVGGGTSGMIKEILKHNPREIIYLEIDPGLINIIRKYLTDDQRKYLENQKVKIINQDARYYLKNTEEKFDIIIANLPNPSAALVNRFFSRDFFRDAKKCLTPSGIFSTHLDLPADYLDRAAENLDASLFKALKKEFSSVAIFPDEDHLFIASNQNLNYDSKIVTDRWKERSLSANFATPEYLAYRLSNDRVQKIRDLIEKNREAKINEDQLPISYYYNLTHWTSLFYPGLANFFSWIGKIKFSFFLFSFLASIAALFVFRKNIKRKPQRILPAAIAAAGFSLIAAELFLIFGFEIFYGYLYYKISLIIAIVMIGMTLGSWLSVKKIKNAEITHLIKIHLVLVIFLVFFLAGFFSLFKISAGSPVLLEFTFLLFAALAGTIVGFEFPLVNSLYLKQKNLPPEEKSSGTIYAFDIFGSSLGAALTGIFLLPVLGIYQSLVLLAIINIAIIVLLLNIKNNFN